MKQIYKEIGYFTAAIAASLGIATALNYTNHKGYWSGTIHRVQTVDFNILSHMLPTKLSYALIEKDYDELQRTLDSNYGLFGIVVTDCQNDTNSCAGQNILYASNSYLSWRTKLDNQGISLLTDSEAPYSILYNPPPLLTTAGYRGSRSNEWEQTGLENTGEIIGRVYYVRGIAPVFGEYYWKWIKGIPTGNLLSDSGAHKYFSLTLAVSIFGSIAVCSAIRILALQKRLKEEKLNRTASELQSIRHERNEILGQNNTLLAELETVKSKAERLNNQLNDQRNNYEGKLEEKLEISRRNKQEIERLEKSLLSVSAQEHGNIAQLEEKNKSISSLTSQIAALQKSDKENTKLIEEYKIQLSLLSTKIRDSEVEVRQLTSRINNIEKSNEELMSRTHILEGRLEVAKIEAANLKRLHQEELARYIKANQKLQEDVDVFTELAHEYAKENDTLKNQSKAQEVVEDIEDYRTYSYQKYSPEIEPEVQSLPKIDFSKIRIALVGGSRNFQNKAVEMLYELGLQKEPVQIFSGDHNTKSDIRSKVSNCNFIFVFYYSSSHALPIKVKKLNSSGAFDNAVIKFYNESMDTNENIFSNIKTSILGTS